MLGQKRFRILTPDRLLSVDTFVLSSEQPSTIQAGCVLVVNQRSGRMLTVHDTRLFPMEAANPAAVVGEPKLMCRTCGKVQGVIEDQVTCPSGDGGPCGLVKPSTAMRSDARLITSS